MKSAGSKFLFLINTVLLTVFIIAFLHSEVGFLRHLGDDHSSHDICMLVSATIPASLYKNSENLTADISVYNTDTKPFTKDPDPKSLEYNNIPPGSYFKSNNLYLQNNLLLI